MGDEGILRGCTSRRGLMGLAVGAAGTRTARAAEAPSWPARPVLYINLFPAGGTTDVMSRLYCAKMSELAGQQFVVENRSGAGGTVGQAAIARAEPDGYTVGLGSVASLAIAPSTYPNLAYDAARDFSFIAGIWKVPNVLITNLDLPVRTVPELITLLKANPGRYTYASSGFGTSPHISMEMFKQAAGVDIVHVPYRGSAPATIDLLAGRVQLMFDNAPTAVAAARDGKVRALAVTSAERVAVASDIPTMREFLPDFQITSWGGLVGPAGMPATAIERLAALSRRALQDPEVIRQFSELAGTTWLATPDEFARFRAEQEQLFAGLIRRSGARIN